MSWFDAAACRSGAFCSVCRDVGADGRGFRVAVVARFGALGVDFECPRGKAWGEPRADMPAQRTAEQRYECLRVCGDCQHEDVGDYGKPACGLMRCASGRTLCLAAFDAALQSGRCPLGKWNRVHESNS